MANYQCKVCLSILPSLNAHSHHQKVHANDHNFVYHCGIPSCLRTFKTFHGLQSHALQSHSSNQRQPQNQPLTLKCTMCEEIFNTSKNLCHHLRDSHIQKGDSIICPFMDVCGRSLVISSKNIFSKHLSQYHRGWNEDSISSSQNLNFHSHVNEHEGSEDDVEMSFGENCNAEESFFGSEKSIDYEEIDVFKYLGKFYMMLETECFLPVATIDKIAENLTFLSEMAHCNMKNMLISELQSEGANVHQIESLVCKLADSNPLYLAHHKFMRGPSFTSEHLRRDYFKKNFCSLQPEPVSLCEDPLEPDAYQYISPREILKILLADPSVQKEIQDSFERFENGSGNNNVYKDYTDGSVCKGRCLPSKRIDLLFFQDGYAATSMLTTVRNKHKCDGVYMTLGNLRPELRTKLKFMHLVIKILEKYVKQYRQKCFERLQKDLKDLEENGIEFMGEVIPVFLQFVVGDNLGSHFLAGFLEGFTANYFCRFCLVTKKEFHSNVLAVKPFRTQDQYNDSVRRVSLAGRKSHQGVKENAVLNKLNNFKVCDPGFPPCLGHDLFHGVVCWDLSSILHNLIEKKKWFSYKLLNRRIASFKYDPFDSKNKPAPVKNDGKKLGGSAVQNWTLLRLLPLIIEDLIKDPEDSEWKLYLKLKHICELVCAPAICEEQIQEMENLTKEYLVESETLSKKTKPKYHYFHHYGPLTRMLGPLIHLWGMRFEQKHQFFKRIARACNNFINLTYTLATRHQLYFAFESLEDRCSEPISKCKSYPIRPGYFSEEISSLIASQNFSPSVQAAASLKIYNLTFEEGALVLLDQRDSDIETGLIEGILLDSNEVSFILRKGRATLNPNCGLYQITEDDGELTVVKLNSLPNFHPQPMYDYEEGKAFSLKHTILPAS